MTPKQIKRKLKAQGFSQKDLARRFGISIPAIHYLCEKRLNSNRLEKRLARLLNVPVEEVRD